MYFGVAVGWTFYQIYCTVRQKSRCWHWKKNFFLKRVPSICIFRKSNVNKVGYFAWFIWLHYCKIAYLFEGNIKKLWWIKLIKVSSPKCWVGVDGESCMFDSLLNDCLGNFSFPVFLYYVIVYTTQSFYRVGWP